MTLLANKIHQGDSVQRLREIEPASVDLVFADPPFNIGYEYDVYEDDRSRGDYLGWCRKWIAALSKVLKPSGTFWLAIGDEYAAQLKLIAEDEVGFSCRSWVIWYYTFGVNCIRGFSRSHTHLFHFVKDKSHFTFNAENPAVRVLSARQLVYADSRANSNGRLPDNTWILRPQDTPSDGFAPMHDTWYFARVAGTFKERAGFHGCQMPEQLLARIVRVSSNPGELILDPFAGSGTTLAVARKLGRQWLGIELSREYVKKIRKRLDDCYSGDELDGPVDPLRSAPTTASGKRKARLRKGHCIPQLDQESERGILDAYQGTCDGYSTDHLLCEPDLNARFADACRVKSLPGDVRTWNRLLLRLRKAGKLSRTGSKHQRLSYADMDSYSGASEISMQLVSQDFGLTLDEILCDPNVAETFDRLADELSGGFTPFEYRWAAMSIRKRARKAKALAVGHCQDWLNRKLPRSTPLYRGTSRRFDRAGVYIVSQPGQILYVGETCNVKARIEQIQASAFWLKLNPGVVKILPSDDHEFQHGLQSILIYRLNPLFNCQLLRPEPPVATELK